jgi:ParB family transcriptional regulator, chromosome partitioning protein
MDQELQMLNLSDLRPNPHNFRTEFNDPEFDELVASICQHGVIQPILVRPNKGDTPFEIIFGERRWRAAKAGSNKKGGKKRIPAMVREINDDEAFDLMVIENLRRKDLSELEEAKGFQDYLWHNGDESLGDLADRCKINPAYIRRRVSVLRLPEEVLKAWGDGEIAYGYLEQLTRLEKKEDILAYFEEVVDGYITSIKDLKREIDGDSVGLDAARFDLEAEGCLACSSNSDVQIRMFEVDAQGSCCLEPKCFSKNQSAWLREHWEETEFHDEYGTTGFRFFDEVDHKDCQGYPGKEAGSECHGCDEFVTLFSGAMLKVFAERACFGSESCFKKKFTRNSQGLTVGASSGSVGSSPQPAGGDDPQGASDEPRVAWHGARFRDIFFKEKIPQRFETLSPRGVKAVHLALFALIQTDYDIRNWFAEFYIRKEDEQPRRVRDSEIFAVITPMSIQEASETLKEAVLQVVMGREFEAEGCRWLVAEHIGIDLAKEWRLNEEYFQKKTIAEMLKFGEELGIFEDAKAQAYLHDKIEKKRFDKCKKTELVDVFLKSGVDLAGKVPKEILAR